MRRLALVLAAAAAVALAPPPHAAEDEAPEVRGSLAWIFSDRLDLVGFMRAEAPIARTGPWRVFVRASAVTAIEKATDFTFEVDEVAYTGGFGARRTLAPGHGAFELSVFEKGRQQVDAPGRARARALGAAWESDRYRQAVAEGWSARVALSAVVEEEGIDTVATTEGGLRWGKRFGRDGCTAFGADLTWDGTIGRDAGVDVLAGPRLDFDMGGDRTFGLYVRYLASGDPLGIDADGVLAGFDFVQGTGAPAGRSRPPDVSGLVAAGGGDGGRGLAQLDVRVQTPPFLYGTYGEIEVEGNALSSFDLSDLFYRYDAGLAHPFAEVWRGGVWFSHRSNHVLDRANPTVTSINVVEGGVETAGWNRAEPGVTLGRAGALDLFVRAGGVVDSTLGNGEDWEARGGLRWAAPEWGPARVYLSAQVELGEAVSSAYAAGVLFSHGFDVRVAVCHDEELFSADKRGVLGVATLRY